MSNAFAIYRLPHARQVFRIEGEAQVIPSLKDLEGRQGFVVAPFVATEETPIVLVNSNSEFRTESVEFATEPEPRAVANSQFSTLSSQLDQYPFSTFHTALLSGRFQKLVLARCAIEANDGSQTPMQLFQKACQLYPRMFIALVSTPQTGIWLTATPEVLLENLPQSDLWQTIALAGTMRLHDDELDGEGLHLRWSTKNIQEQRYVASYIADTLQRLGLDYQEEGPRTVRAANLVHLRSDFTFHLPPFTSHPSPLTSHPSPPTSHPSPPTSHLSNNNTRVGELLAALHPTPAVCGLPKKDALEFILQNEPSPRRYYSGFMGPLHVPCSTFPVQRSTFPVQRSTSNVQRPTSSTHLYVTLRCMQIMSDSYRLYAGGGLLRDSICEKEWRETEAKMETMRQLINQ